MKNCPLCNTAYTDDTLNFCLNDGSQLITDDSAATVPDFQLPNDRSIRNEIIYPEKESVETVIASPPLEKTIQSLPPSEIASSSLPITLPSSPRRKYQTDSPLTKDGSFGNRPSEFHFEVPNNHNRQPERKPAKYLLFALPVLLFAVAGAWWFFAHKNSSVDENDAQPVNSAANTNLTANADNKSSLAAASPTALPKTADELNLAGTWTGTSGVTPTTLIIEKGDGNNFSGTKVEGNWESAFTGTIDPVSRQITWSETKLLKGDSRAYSLGVNTGKISSDGRKISGTGRDKFSKYPWSFNKR